MKAGIQTQSWWRSFCKIAYTSDDVGRIVERMCSVYSFLQCNLFHSTMDVLSKVEFFHYLLIFSLLETTEIYYKRLVFILGISA
jgi:hypothetical protein